MPYAQNTQSLEIAAARFSDLLTGLHHAVITGRDSYESAAKVAVLAHQIAKVEAEFWEAVSALHCDALEIAGETPCENSDDFADWAKRVAHDRSYAPFEGVRGVTKHHRPVVDLRPLMAAE